MIELKRILFPTDFSDFSRYAASFAVSFACDYGAQLFVLHVLEPPPWTFGGELKSPSGPGWAL